MATQIRYYSTNQHSGFFTFKEALLKGLAPDKGLFMPDDIPFITWKELKSYTDRQYHEIAFKVARKFLSTEIPQGDLFDLIREAYNFDIPLEHIQDKKYMMRLDQGPTASFKDFAARMMGRLMQYFLHRDDRQLVILVATSGDTGSAIANAFYGLENIKVVVLFPEKEVTPFQRKQMTTLQDNICSIAINGKFDDCQALVKKAFSDPQLNTLDLSSANSINIGRLLPQSIYYIYAYTKLGNIPEREKIVFCVPSGNFGNLMGGLIANKMGLPVKRFVIATNENDEVPVYFRTGDYKIISPSLNCISSAMNVGHPSNMARIITLYNGLMNERGEIIKSPDLEKMRKDMYAVSISDVKTRETIKEVWNKFKVLLEPHGAVGWAGLLHDARLNEQNDGKDQLYVSLETAHPAKFSNEIKELLNFEPGLSEGLKEIESKKEQYIGMENKYDDFKHFLLESYS